MGSLALHAHEMNRKNEVIKKALVHFDTILVDETEKHKLRAAADEAHTDEFLFEKFESWVDERDDKYLLFHVNSFFEDRLLKVLSPTERDVTSRRKEIELTIENKSRDKQKRIVSERLSILAKERSLNTNEAIANFLNMDIEQIRRYLIGENKPQRATLIKIAEKFDVSLEYLGGFSQARE